MDHNLSTIRRKLNHTIFFNKFDHNLASHNMVCHLFCIYILDDNMLWPVFQIHGPTCGAHCYKMAKYSFMSLIVN